MADFLSGATKKTISANVYKRSVYTKLGLACEVLSGSACGTPSVPLPTNVPTNKTDSWSGPYNCAASTGFVIGQEVPHMMSNTLYSWAWFEKVTADCLPGLWKIVTHREYYYWAVKDEIKLDWTDAFDGPLGLRDIYPYEDGWRIIAVVPAGTELGEPIPLSGLQFVTENDYKEYVADSSGEADGGSSASYSGDTSDPNIQLHEGLASLHETGGVGEDANSYTVVSLSDDAITYDGTEATLNLTAEDGIENSAQWDVGSHSQPYVGGCTLETPRYMYARRKFTPDLCSYDVYLKKVDSTTGAGVGTGDFEEPSTALDPGTGNYTSSIDGGIDDRSNGQRFIGSSYSDLNGFDVDGSVIHDNLYVPKTSTTRWGETLTLTDPGETYNGRTIGNAFVAGPGDFLSYDITVESIENRMSDPDTMTFVENCKYDDVGSDCIHIGTPAASETNGLNIAGNAFDWLDATYWEATSSDADLEWDFGYYELGSSPLASATIAGDGTITLVDASNFPPEGVITITDTVDDYVAYTSKAGNVLSGIPTDVADSLSVDAHTSGRVCSIGVLRSGKTILKYSIKVDSDINTAPKDWVFQGSVDGSTWIALDTQTGVIWTADQEQSFSCNNSTRYRYYRLHITDSGDGSDLKIVEFGMYEADTYTVGDWVYGILVTPSGPVTRFAGVIVSKHRELSEGNQTVRYEASGLIQRLNDLGFAFEVSFLNKTIRSMAELVTNSIPQQVVVAVEGLDLLPETVIPDINWTCLSYKKALDMLMDYAGHFGYYVTPGKILHFVNLRYDDTSTETQARDDLRKISYAVPTEGAPLSGGNYYVTEQSLSIDVSSAKTLCKIMGDYPKMEITESIPVVSSEYTAGGALRQPPYAVEVVKTSAVGDDAELEATFMVVLSNNKIQTQLLSDPDKSIEVSVKYTSGSYSGVQVNSGWWEPRSNPYNFVTRDEFSAFYINTFKPLVELEVTYVYKDSSPLLADTGWIGTAYSDFGVQNAILVQDSRFQKHIIRGEVVRDDSQDLLKFARQLIDPYKDWYVGGSLQLDGFRSELDLDNFVNFTGTSQDWTLINAYPKSIAFNFIDLSTRAELTNNYFVGSILDPNVIEDIKVIKDSEEIQIILNRLRSLETKENQF